MPMRLRASSPGRSLTTKLLLLFLLLALVPVGILALLVSHTSRQIRDTAIAQGSRALVQGAEESLMARTQDFADRLNLELQRIEGDGRMLADYLEGLYSHPTSYRRYWAPGRYEMHPRGFLWTPRDLGAGALLGGSRSTLTAAMREEIALTEHLDPLLKRIAANNPDCVAVYFVSATGLIRTFPWFDAIEAVRGGTLHPEQDVTEHPVFSNADPRHDPSRSEVWSGVYLDAAGRGWMVTCSVPVYSAGDQFCGVVGLDVTVEQFSRKIRGLRVGDAGYAFLLTSKGGVIAFHEEGAGDLGWRPEVRPDEFNLLEGPIEALRGAVGERIAGGAGVRRIPFASGEKLLSFGPIPTAGWSLAVAAPVGEITRAAGATAEEIREETSILRRRTALFSLLLLAGAVTVALLTARRITTPIRSFARGAATIGRGDLDHRVEVTSRDEIGELAASFNAMARSLQERERELERVQQELLRNERLSSMGLVAASVAHEIRNSLGAIKNSAYLLRSKFTGEDPLLRKHLDLMDREIEEADRIITDVLDFVGPMRPTLRPVDVNGMLARLLEAVPPEDGVAVERRLDPALPLIPADAALLRRVFNNLILNACQAMRGAGTLTVRTAQEDGFLRVEIQDTGPGIEGRHLPHLFDPFFTTKAQGIGLGLTLSRRIVEAHGGRLEVESRRGAGTTFFIRLPLAHARGEAPEGSDA